MYIHIENEDRTIGESQHTSSKSQAGVSNGLVF